MSGSECSLWTKPNKVGLLLLRGWQWHAERKVLRSVLFLLLWLPLSASGQDSAGAKLQLEARAFLASNVYFLAESDLLGANRPPSDFDADVTFEQRVFIASKVYSLLQLYYSSIGSEVPPDLDDQYRTFLHNIIPATDDRSKFDLSTIEFVAKQGNGHTFFWDTWLDQSDNRTVGFYALPLNGKWVVQTSWHEGLRPGDVISKIDDVAMESFFLRQQRYIAASSKVAQRRNLFLFPYLFPDQFELTLEDGKQIVVDRRALNNRPEGVEGRWLKRYEIAYIRIPSFLDPRFQELALNYVQQFHHARVLIVDVRNNPGGIPPERLVEALMDRPYRGWLQVTSHDCLPCAPQQPATVQEPAGGTQERGNLTQLAQSNKPIAPIQNPFRGRLILLVDGGCVSACEDFIEPSKDSGRAILVGETTQGSAGIPLFYDFHNGMTLKIAYKTNYLPDGSEFEGVGIKPDVEVHTTIDDLKKGRDPILEKALQLAAEP